MSITFNHPIDSFSSIVEEECGGKTCFDGTPLPIKIRSIVKKVLEEPSESSVDALSEIHHLISALPSDKIGRIETAFIQMLRQSQSNQSPSKRAATDAPEEAETTMKSSDAQEPPEQKMEEDSEEDISSEKRRSKRPIEEEKKEEENPVRKKARLSTQKGASLSPSSQTSQKRILGPPSYEAARKAAKLRTLLQKMDLPFVYFTGDFERFSHFTTTESLKAIQDPDLRKDVENVHKLTDHLLKICEGYPDLKESITITNVSNPTWLFPFLKHLYAISLDRSIEILKQNSVQIRTILEAIPPQESGKRHKAIKKAFLEITSLGVEVTLTLDKVFCVPEEIGLLKNLTTLCVANSPIESIPYSIQASPKLRYYMIQNQKSRVIIPYNQSSLSIQTFPQLVYISSKYGGLCELICNRILQKDLLGRSAEEANPLRQEVTAESLAKEEVSRSHLLEICSTSSKIMSYLFSKYPQNIFSYFDQMYLLQYDSAGNKTLNIKLFEKGLDSVPIGTYIKFETFSIRLRSFRGHSCLIKKVAENEFIFFDPNKGEERSFTKEALGKKISERIAPFTDRICFLNGTQYLEELRRKKIYNPN